MTEASIEVGFRGLSAALKMVQDLIKCGASDEEINSAVTDLTTRVSNEAHILIDRRKSGKAVDALA